MKCSLTFDPCNTTSRLSPSHVFGPLGGPRELSIPPKRRPNRGNMSDISKDIPPYILGTIPTVSLSLDLIPAENVRLLDSEKRAAFVDFTARSAPCLSALHRLPVAPIAHIKLIYIGHHVLCIHFIPRTGAAATLRPRRQHSVRILFGSSVNCSCHRSRCAFRPQLWLSSIHCLKTPYSISSNRYRHIPC